MLQSGAAEVNVRASCQAITKRYGDHEVLRGVDWQIHAGQRWALVGPNGSGKTTLLRIIAGKEEPDGGRLARARGLRIATVPQRDLAGVSTSARGYLLLAYSHVLKREEKLARLHRRMAEGEADPRTLESAADIQEWLLHHGGYSYETEIDRALTGLGFAGKDGERPCGSFSGGEQMRLKLARAILDPADLLLLDEPGNHLDERQRAWLGEFLRGCSRAMVVVTHDPAIVDRAVDHVACLMDGRVSTFRGDYASFERQFEEMQKTRERAYEQQQAYIARTKAFIRRYKAGQRTKQARGREKQLARLERIPAPVKTPKGFKLDLSFHEVPGEDVLTVEELLLSLGERCLAAEKLALKRGMRVALVGPNGSGKTTLLKTLTGESRPRAGTIRWGTNVRLAHYDQHQRRFPFKGSLFDTVASLLDSPNRELVMSHLGAFGFGGGRADQNVGSLSGGERARLHLLAVLLARANVLILDEPTNHLDAAATAVLDSALSRFKGTLVLVSHDEELLAAQATHTWAVAGDRVHAAPGFSPDLIAAGEKPHSAPRAAANPSEVRVRPTGGLSKNERFRLERTLREAEASIARLTKAREELECRFASPDSVVSEDWHTLTNRFEKVKTELARAEERWLTATAKLEEGEGGSPEHGGTREGA